MKAKQQTKSIYSKDHKLYRNTIKRAKWLRRVAEINCRSGLDTEDELGELALKEALEIEKQCRWKGY